MGSRQLGELLLRPSSLRTITNPHTSSPLFRQSLSHRPFSISAARLADHRTPPAAKFDSGSQPTTEPSTEDAPATSSDPFAQAFSSKPRSQNDTSEAIDSLIRSSGVGQQRRPHDTRFGSAAPAPRSQFGSSFSRPNPSLRPTRLNFEDMNLPDSDISSAPSSFVMPVVDEKDIVYPRLNASTGRTVELDAKRGRDIVRGLGMLGSLMARNQVKKDFNKQRFHERPGLKRKRLKTERWRARFKTEFSNTCKRVTELTRKGW